MSKLFTEFNKSSKAEWLSALEKELKGAKIEDVLIKVDEIEALNYPSFFHSEDLSNIDNTNNSLESRRSYIQEPNDWSIVGQVKVNDSKEANEKALDLLMKGNSALQFIFETENCDLEILFKDIEFQYIKLFIVSGNQSLLSKIAIFFEKHDKSEIYFCYNPLANIENLSPNDLFSGASNFEIDAYSLQQTGANCSQEIAFALALGHEYLIQQINLGRTIENALQNIHFTFGIGANYLFEISKLRAFRTLWTYIVKQYVVESEFQIATQITAKTGFLNKSLKDPYTNLLRQTTEVMSAILGGADNIINQAYDANSEQGTSENAERLATNISLILKEESYLEKVLDACGGSYAIEKITETLADNAWGIFQEIEGSENLKKSSLFDHVKQTAALRIKLLQENKKTLIGVNKFPSPQESHLSYAENSETYFGLVPLILEKQITL